MGPTIISKILGHKSNFPFKALTCCKGCADAKVAELCVQASSLRMGHLLSICFLQSSSGSEHWQTRGCSCWVPYRQQSWNRQRRQVLRHLLLSLNTHSLSPQQISLIQGVIAPRDAELAWGLRLPTAVSAGSSGGKSGAIKASVDKACRSGSYKEVRPFVGAWLLSVTITALDENIVFFFFFPLHLKI